MTKEKKSVALETICIHVTPAQKQLLELLDHSQVDFHYTALKHVHHFGTYHVHPDKVESLQLWEHGIVHELIDALYEIHKENCLRRLPQSA